MDKLEKLLLALSMLAFAMLIFLAVFVWEPK